MAGFGFNHQAMAKDMEPKAAELIEKLELQPHPEGGYYREVFRSAAAVAPADEREARSALTSIYFLLVPGQHSRWHQVRSDEIWHFYEGAPLELFWIDKSGGRFEQRLLGPAAESRRPVAVVPAGCWQAARTTGPYTLLGCTMGPGFEFADFRMLKDVPDQAARITERFPHLAALL